MLTAEQILSAQKSNVDTFFGLSSKALEGLGKFVELSLGATKTSLDEAAAAAQSVLSVKDVQEFVSLQTSLLQPQADKFTAYGRSVYDLAASTGAEFTKAAELQFAAVQGELSSVLESALKNAPAGSEGAVSLVKSTLAAASNAYETVNQAAKQAASAADANFQALTATTAKVASASKRRAA